MNNANDYWTQVKNVFLNVIDKHAPCRTIKVQKLISLYHGLPQSDIKQHMHSRDKQKKKAMKSTVIYLRTGKNFK